MRPPPEQPGSDTRPAVKWIYRHLVRPPLFARDSEAAHEMALRILGRVSRHEALCDLLAWMCASPAVPVEVFGLRFPNPVGLAAGMDKAAEAVPAWEALGFGFCELGGVTWHPQAGNPKPRMFRAVADRALVNRMGFNNPGAEAVAQRLARWRESGRWPKHPVGINLGKSKVTPLEQAAEDYSNSFRVLQPFVDFFVVNVSSPNTPNLRQLQDKAALSEILASLQEINVSASSGNSRRPILVKVAPDLSLEALDEILELAGPRQIAGIVATNTTTSRPAAIHESSRGVMEEAGGLSGAPLRQRSTEVIRHIHRQTSGSLPIIGLGGIFNAQDAWEKICAGASLVQLYTGLVYEGPGIVQEIVRGLARQGTGAMGSHLNS